jgi:hypothetical protein
MCVCVCGMCAGAEDAVLDVWAYWCTVVSIMVRSLGDGQMGMCRRCTTRMREKGCVSEWLDERRGRWGGLGLDV